MKPLKIHVYADKKCKVCGKPGATDYGWCLNSECMAAAINRKEGMKTKKQTNRGFIAEAWLPIAIVIASLAVFALGTAITPDTYCAICGAHAPCYNHGQ